MPPSPDILVIGSGVFGLSVAERARCAGLSVTLAEAEHLGAGASGGPVGALVPHDPGHWTALKAFQLAGLTTLPRLAARLAEATGRDPGWQRSGRLMPLADEAARERALRLAGAAAARWPKDTACTVLDRPPRADWPGTAAAPWGVLHETLSARLWPRRWLSALRASLAPSTRVLKGWRLQALDPAGGARFDRGSLAAGHVVVATGWQAFAHLRPLAALPGGGVKGQAALLAASADGLPLIAGRGLFVVPQPRGVAVGSTRETEWADRRPDARLEAVLARARALSPRLRDAPVRARWAGIRPRAQSGLPLVGALPGHPRLLVATGAGGIGFAIAHLVADALVSGLTGEVPLHPLPSGAAPQLSLAPPAG